MVSGGGSVHAPEMCFSDTCTLKLGFGDLPENLVILRGAEEPAEVSQCDL